MFLFSYVFLLLARMNSADGVSSPVKNRLKWKILCGAPKRMDWKPGRYWGENQLISAGCEKERCKTSWVKHNKRENSATMHALNGTYIYKSWRSLFNEWNNESNDGPPFKFIRNDSSFSLCLRVFWWAWQKINNNFAIWKLFNFIRRGQWEHKHWFNWTHRKYTQFHLITFMGWFSILSAMRFRFDSYRSINWRGCTASLSDFAKSTEHTVNTVNYLVLSTANFIYNGIMKCKFNIIYMHTLLINTECGRVFHRVWYCEE